MDIIIQIMVSLGVSIIGTIGSTFVVLAKYREKVDRLEKDKIATDSTLTSFTTDIATLKEFKVQAQKFMDKSIYKSSSPLSLTELGNKLINESGFKDIFEKEKGNLAMLLADKRPKNKYDVQEMSISLMDSLVNYSPFTPIKSYAYNKGQDYGQILRAGAILLRDYYLSIHPEIKN